MRMDCKERVFCTHCRTANHDTKAWRKYQSNAPNPTNSHSPAGCHPTATPPPLIGAAAAIQQTQQTVSTNNGQLFQNLFDKNQPKISTTIHTLFNGTSPAPSANMTEALTQIMAQVTQVANNNKKDLPQNWIPERKQQIKLSEFFENPFIQKEDDFLKHWYTEKFYWRTKTFPPKHKKPLMSYARNMMK